MVRRFQRYDRFDGKLGIEPSKVGFMLSGTEHSPVVEQNPVLTNCVQTLLSVNANDEMISYDTPCSEERSLNESVEKFWDLDSIGILENEKSTVEKTVEKIQIVDGRYEVELPMKENHPILHDNYFACVKRLGALRNRLEKGKLMERYDDIIQQQIRDGMVEVIPEDETVPIMGEVTYIPHRAVVKEDKVTTKVRIVYDCSAKSGGNSLNECMYKGPCLTPLIFDSLLRFRLHNVAIVADIASAYLHVSVVPSQRNLLRFLWFSDVKKDDYAIQKLRFKRVLFGAAPSQFLLNAVVRNLAESYRDTDPDFFKIVNRGFYVDDLNTSVHNSCAAVEFYEKCKARFKKVSFDVRKWRTNDPILKQVLVEKEEKFEKLENGKVLGIPWHDEDDVFVIRLCDFIPDDLGAKVTKRTILKTVASFYDPPGWIQPAVIKLKILFQEAWKVDADWDEELPENIARPWKLVIAELKEMNEVRIYRPYCKSDDSNPVVRVTIHGFSDASQKAYFRKWRSKDLSPVLLPSKRQRRYPDWS